MYSNIEHIIRSDQGKSLVNEELFEKEALNLFYVQAKSNAVYQSYLENIGIQPPSVTSLSDIPFLPISFFKTHKVVCLEAGESANDWQLFESSGTSQMNLVSKHWVKDVDLYLLSCEVAFERLYGSLKDYVFLCLLPSYLERQHSSLVRMAQHFIAVSGQQEQGFYLNQWDELAQTIQTLQRQSKKIILLGVTFALLDFSEAYPIHLYNCIVMETGGMKGRKAEQTRAEVHAFLKQQWQIEAIHTEYGMTELLSQAYAKFNGLLVAPPWMRVYVREQNDPLHTERAGGGALNIIDLANIHSCAFIATEDVGNVFSNGMFEVLGRQDYTALRGCSLMVVD